MSSNSGNVYVVDDDMDLASSLARLLERSGYNATPFRSPQRCIEALPTNEAGCILTDVMMNETGGFEFAKTLRRTHPYLGVLFMTAWPKTVDAVNAVRELGGVDYMEKPLDEDRLMASVRRAMTWSLAKSTAATRLTRLSKREREVFGLVAAGRSSKVIAAHFGLSIKTVEDHRASILKKTGATKLADLVDLHRISVE